MRVLRTEDSQANPANSPLFEGDVASRPLVMGGDATWATVNWVRFRNGGRNKFHTHSAEQILYITEGRGIVATREEEAHVAGGDIVSIPPGEAHWHGAEPGQDMAHLSILPPGSQTEIVGD